MSDSIPQTWKTDNLFLLIGGNPLPNYVAAHLLKKDDGVLHLLYSSDTEAIAKRLSEYFPDSFKMHQIQDPADPGEIDKAVHVHQIISRKCRDAVCTYLDPWTKTLRCDHDVRQPEILYLTKPNTETLFEIHDVALTNALTSEESQPIFPELY